MADKMSSSASPLPASDRTRSIVLVGLMGAGKSAIGKRLAARLGLPFHDSDEEIEKAAGMSVADIFARFGEAHFREGERRVIERLLAGPPIVLATGGGAFMNAETRAVIRGRAVSIWLRASIPVLLARVSGRTHRPLLNRGDPEEILATLSARRNPVYALADLVVDSTENPPDMTTDSVMDALATHATPQIVRVPLDAESYDVRIGRALLGRAGAELADILPQRRAIVISDETVAKAVLPRLATALDAVAIAHETLTVPPGEASKSLSAYGRLAEQVLALRPERRTTIIALGGGVIGDLAGFVAATILRGLPFVQIPTTLLSQVDSSVGGKTGINATAGKNLIGAFHQPKGVLIDPDTLASLPGRELAAGYAEIVKAGLIADADLYRWCEEHGAALLGGDRTLQEQAITRAVAFKAKVVGDDPHETRAEGARALLNLGHTFAHAFEAEAGYGGSLLHGEAVAIGLVCAFDLSARLGHAPETLADRVAAHLREVGLPTRIPDMQADRLLAHMQGDKKVLDGRLRFILARDIGAAFIDADVPPDAVRATLLARGATA